MSGLMDKLQGKAEGMLNSKSQPGDQVESGAENTANNGMSSPCLTCFQVWTNFHTAINDIGNYVGVPHKDDSMIDKVADSKINSDIPLGNDSNLTGENSSFWVWRNKSTRGRTSLIIHWDAEVNTIPQ